MTSINLNDITTGYNLSNINANFTTLENSVNTDLLNRSGGNNTMNQQLDMNNNDIININVDPTNPASIATIAQINAEAATRAAADVILQNNINIETAARVAGDLAQQQYTDEEVAGVVGGYGFFQQPLPSSVGRTFNSKMAEVISVTDFGAVGDGVTDNLAAFNAAHDALASGGKIIIPIGKFYLSGTWVLQKPLTIEGANCDFHTASASTQLLVAPNNTGIIVYSTNSPSGSSANNSYLKGFTLTPSASGGTTGYGIQAYAQFKITDCNVQAFPQDGLNITTTSSVGNANTWTAYDCQFSSNGGNGISVNGANSNVGTAINCRCYSNGGWGIYDNSSLGNTYINCNGSYNVVGAFKNIGASARSQFIGCYMEGSAACVEFSQATIVVGGYMGSEGISGGNICAPLVVISGTGGSGASARAVVNGSGIITAVIPTALGSNYTAATVTLVGGSGSGATITPNIVNGQITSYTVNAGGTGYVSSALYASLLAGESLGGFATGRLESVTQNIGNASAQTIVSLHDSQNDAITLKVLGASGTTALAYWNSTTGCWQSGYNNTGQAGWRLVTELSTTETAGRLSVVPNGSLIFPTGFWVGSGSSACYVGIGSAAPTSGNYALGDTILNRSVVPGGNAGWKCTTSGYVGTATAWAASTAYSTLGTFRSNGGNNYVLTAAGTSASSGGPTGTGTGIVDGTCTWNYVPVAVFSKYGVVTLEGSGSYGGGTIASGSSGILTTISVTGASLNDFAIGSLSVSNQGLLITANVSSGNTVQVVAANLTGSSVTLGACTVMARVIKQ